MDNKYKGRMDIDQKERVALRGDMGLIATSKRLKAARLIAGYDVQKKFAKDCGVSITSYNNMEKGMSFPNREVMKFLYRGHRIDFNFIINGDFAQLPLDVEQKLFDELLKL
jgi:transcriptional regulator with XRE-family HTH domain